MTKKIFKKFLRWIRGSSGVYIRVNNTSYEPTISYHINEVGDMEIWLEPTDYCGRSLGAVEPDALARSAAVTNPAINDNLEK